MMPGAFKKKPIDKRIPKNPRYDDILATVDSGASLSSYLRRLDEANGNFKIKPGEIFRRMKMTTFVQLLIQVADVNGTQGRQEFHPNGGGLFVDESKNTKECTKSSDQPGSRAAIFYTLGSVIHGIGECEINGDKELSPDRPTNTTEEKSDCPYLLLDVRDRDEFDQCHIIKAISYPHTMLSRCINFEIRQMLAFRNKPGHIIICYDEDERLAPRVATMLTERGYENIFVLSGGLKVGWKLFPKGLILGDAPVTLKNKPGKRPQYEKNILRLSTASVLNSAPSVCNSAASSARGSTVGSRCTTSSARRAVQCTFDTYEAVGSRGTPNGGEDFSMIDLEHLSLALDSLCANCRANRSSRISTAESVRSRAPSASTLGNSK
uniref:Rhodanese domain-containing protein n=1 Tax=Echinococcus canadensis TaxID=519352 RepID=A0A915EW11_9CEST